MRTHTDTTTGAGNTAAAQTTDRDWNNNEVEFVVGDRVIYYADDVTKYKGTVAARTPMMLHIDFDNGDQSWQSTRFCELCNWQEPEATNAPDTMTDLYIQKTEQVADLLNTLREIYWLAAEAKRSHIANIIGSKAIDAINKHAA